MVNVRDRWKEKQGLLIRLMSLIILVMMLSAVIVSNAQAVPVGPQITFNSTTNSTPRPAAAITTAGGTFTTLTLNATGQTYRWKAYVGNVSGRLVLADANNMSVFDWRVSSVSGEVYATRSNSIDWSSIACAATSTIETEDTFMNMSTNIPDTINKTFNYTTHRTFFVGGTRISNSTCRSVPTYVNGAAQTVSENAAFQQILLQDASANLVYTTLVNASAVSYNGVNRYDFQMIIAENEYNAVPTNYYLYVELT